MSRMLPGQPTITMRLPRQLPWPAVRLEISVAVVDRGSCANQSCCIQDCRRQWDESVAVTE